MRGDHEPHAKRKDAKRGNILLPSTMKSTQPGYPFESRFSGNGSAYDRIYETIRRIPRGRIATYGQIAGIVGRITPRMVGYAMAALRGRTDVPWQRVINYKGEISARAAGDGSIRQRRLLEAEGIRFDSRGRVDLKKVRWNGGREARWR